jgi:hypothetical protein
MPAEIEWAGEDRRRHRIAELVPVNLVREWSRGGEGFSG